MYVLWFDRWHATIQHVKQFKQVSDSCSFNVSLDSSLCEEPKSSDDLSIIMNVYAESLTKHKNGEYENPASLSEYL